MNKLYIFYTGCTVISENYVKERTSERITSKKCSSNAGNVVFGTGYPRVDSKQVMHKTFMHIRVFINIHKKRIVRGSTIGEGGRKIWEPR